jgi:ABC-type Na+ efflux pump permease subunit
MRGINVKNVNFWILIAVILAILFLSCLVYICVSKYKISKEKQENLLIMQGYQLAINDLVNGAANCQPVAVQNGNVSMQLVDTSCLSSK